MKALWLLATAVAFVPLGCTGNAPPPVPTPTPTPTPVPTPTPSPTPTPPPAPVPVPPPPPMLCPDGTTVPAGQVCPPPVVVPPPEPAPVPVPTPPPAPAAQWAPAPLTDGGYAQCNVATGCHSFSYPCLPNLNPPSACSYPDVIAQFGDVQMYMWDGWSASWPGGPDGYPVGAFWPVGHFGEQWAGTEGNASEWRGVVPVTTPTAVTLRRGVRPQQVRRNLDKRFEAVGVRNCLTPDRVTGSTSFSMSGVTKGAHYVASNLWGYKRGGVQFVGAKPMDSNGALGMATVPRSCLRAITAPTRTLPATSKLLPLPKAR